MLLVSRLKIQTNFSLQKETHTQVSFRAGFIELFPLLSTHFAHWLLFIKISRKSVWAVCRPWKASVDSATAFDGVLSLLKHTQKPLLNRSMSDPSICHDGDETSVLSKYYISCSCFVQSPRHTREPMPFWHQRCQHDTKIQLLSPGELLYSLNTPWAPVIICNLCWRSLRGLSSLSQTQ